jgi:hypothetical protein
LYTQVKAQERRDAFQSYFFRVRIYFQVVIFSTAYLASADKVVPKVKSTSFFFALALTAAAGVQSFHCRDGEASVLNAVVNVRQGEFAH